jgi:hypothetical protein
LRKLRFLLRGEMHFHRLQITAKPTSTQHFATEVYLFVWSCPLPVTLVGRKRPSAV